jgi:lipoprotein-anchoring transpeptidase ErfK/SrfK
MALGRHNVGRVLRRLHLCSIVFASLVVVGTTGPGRAAAPAKQDSFAFAGCVRGSIHSVRTDRLSYSVTALHPLNARRALVARGSSTRFEMRNANGVAMVFGVVAARVDRSCSATDYKVQLPIRPSGATGWVRAVDVRLRAVHTRIVVDLSQRRITLFRDGRTVLVATAVIGAPSTPTPTGRFYVNQRLLAANPAGAYGPGAVGISAFSPVLLNWAQGGPIAIHGTNAPDMIGSAVSHGCLRVRNADIRRLLRLAEEGTPVEIRL